MIASRKIDKSKVRSFHKSKPFGDSVFVARKGEQNEMNSSSPFLHWKEDETVRPESPPRQTVCRGQRSGI